MSLLDNKFFNPDGSLRFGTSVWEYYEKNVKEQTNKAFNDATNLVLDRIHESIDAILTFDMDEYKAIKALPDKELQNKLDAFAEICQFLIQQINNNSIKTVKDRAKAVINKCEDIMNIPRGNLIFDNNEDEESSEEQNIENKEPEERRQRRTQAEIRKDARSKNKKIK